MGKRHTCCVCGVTAVYRCSGCRKAKYCGQEHQREHWTRHKEQCQLNSKRILPKDSAAHLRSSKVSGLRSMVEASRAGGSVVQSNNIRPDAPPKPSAVTLDMPPEILQQVFSFMSPQQLAVCSLVCREWRSLGSEDWLWNQHSKSGRVFFGSGHSTNAASTTSESPEESSSGNNNEGSKMQYSRMRQLESNWKNGRYKTDTIKSLSWTVQCLSLQYTSMFGEVLLVGSWDGVLRIFAVHPDPLTLDTPQLRRYTGHGGWVTSCIASTSSMVALGNGEVLTVARLTDPTPCFSLAHHASVLQARFVAADTVITSCTDGTVNVWSLDTGEQLHVLWGHEDACWNLTHLHPTTLVSAARDGRVKIWDWSEGRCVRTLDDPVRSILALDCSPRSPSSSPSAPRVSGHHDYETELPGEQQGVLLAVGYNDGTIKVFDLGSGEETCCLSAPSPAAALCVKFAMWEEQADWSRKQSTNKTFERSRLWIVSGSMDGSVRVWDPIKGTCKAFLDHHKKPVISLLVHGNMLVSCGLGEGVLVHLCAPKPDTHQQDAASLPHASGTAPAVVLLRGGTLGGEADAAADAGPNLVRLRSVGPAGRLREAVSAARSANSEGFTTILSLMDTNSQGSATAVVLDSKRLIVGTKHGSVHIFDYT